NKSCARPVGRVRPQAVTRHPLSLHSVHRMLRPPVGLMKPTRPTRCGAWHNPAMRTYLVGGAVRDKLLGRTAFDRDYVVVGARPEELTALGYKPVGRDFPVFLHPDSGEEYALARTERKSGRGYH